MVGFHTLVWFDIDVRPWAAELVDGAGVYKTQVGFLAVFVRVIRCGTADFCR